MKLRKILLPVLALSLTFTLFGCKKSNNSSTPTEYDYLGGGKEGVTPTSTSTTEKEETIDGVIKTLNKTDVSDYDLDSATTITSGGSIASSGTYLITGTINLSEAISFTKKATIVHLIIKDANITVTDDKAISSKNDLEITFLGTNTIKNVLGESNSDENLIKCGGNLTINGTGTTTLTSTKSGIKVDGICNLFSSTLNINAASHGISSSIIYLDGATLNIESEKDGLHAEIDYDEVEDASTVVYDVNNGYIYIKSGNVTINSTDDGMQADTFIRIDGGTINIDYTLATDPDTDIDFESEEYGLIINNGNITINSNDDAIHSNGYFIINGGSATISTGDDGIHAEAIGEFNGGTYTIVKSYEGYEAAKINITGGTLNITSTDDGINAADGTETRMGVGNTNCYMIISGGTITVNALGDGLDSNNSILISGGTIYVDGPTNGGNGSLDSETGIIVNGGELIAVGALGMVETPASNSSQYSINYTSKSTLSANTNIKLVDANNNTVMEYTTLKTSQSIIISSSKLVKGSTYKLYINGTLTETITISSTITTAGSSSQGFNPGGPGFRP